MEIRAELNEPEEPKCPVCGEPCIYDEVDIGVGTQRGNIRCELCGWGPEKKIDSYFKSVDRRVAGGAMKTFIVHVSVDAESKDRAEVLMKHCVEVGAATGWMDAAGGEVAVVLDTTDEIED